MSINTTNRTRKWFSSVYYLKDTDLGVGNKKEQSRPFPKLIHKTRDGLALLELSIGLGRAGFIYGGSILQIPFDVWDKGRRYPNINITEGQLTSKDLIVQATRPPLIENGVRPSMDDTGVKRSLTPSGTKLEEMICFALGQFVETCDRSQMILQRHVQLADNCQKYRAVTFYQSGGGLAKEFSTGSGRKGERAPTNIAIGYLLSIPHLYQNGPRLMLSFSMGGAETLWFCHLLVNKLDCLYRKALKSREAQFWLIPFRCPDYTPFPKLSLIDDRAYPGDVVEVTLDAGFRRKQDKRKKCDK